MELEMEFDLATPDVLQALLFQPKPSRKKRGDITATEPIPAEALGEVPAPHKFAARSRRCTCGACVGCKDNARWERIFHEKFADPTYYSRSWARHPSPLNS